MFRLLALGTMVGIGIGAYKFFKKKQTSTPTETSLQEETQHCEQETC